MRKLTNYKAIVFFAFIFCIIYCLISLVNHYNFRTYAFDLGIYTNALYDYIHFQWNDSGVFKAVSENLLSDHFDLYLMIFSPFSLVFGTYTLLIIQIASILIGGFGVYAFFRASKKSASLALLAALFFYSFFGVFAALSYDYHSNVVAAAVVPWFFYLIKKKRIWKSFLLLLFILIGKENISLWMIFVCLGLAIEYRKSKVLRNYLLGMAVFCAAYFIVITSFLMPAFSNSGELLHFRYGILGSSTSEAFIHLVSNPLETIKTLFVNHSGKANGDYVKLELHLFLLFSGLPFLFWRPQFILMLIPIYFQKLFHDRYLIWGVGYQYSIEFAPILAIGVFLVISDMKREKLKMIMAYLVLFFTIATTIRSMDHTICYTDKSRIRVYSKKHLYRNYDVSAVHKELDRIPPNAVVSVQSPFLTHLALRDKVYEFPIIKDADYIVYSQNENAYPLNQKDFDALCAELEQSSKWSIIYDKDIKVLKRN